MEERRKTERCVYCNGVEVHWLVNGKLKKYCLICGKDFVARREDDLHKFKKFAKEFNS